MARGSKSASGHPLARPGQMTHSGLGLSVAERAVPDITGVPTPLSRTEAQELAHGTCATQQHSCGLAGMKLVLSDELKLQVLSPQVSCSSTASSCCLKGFGREQQRMRALAHTRHSAGGGGL